MTHSLAAAAPTAVVANDWFDVIGNGADKTKTTALLCIIAGALVGYLWILVKAKFTMGAVIGGAVVVMLIVFFAKNYDNATIQKNTSDTIIQNAPNGMGPIGLPDTHGPRV